MTSYGLDRTAPQLPATWPGLGELVWLAPEPAVLGRVARDASVRREIGEHLFVGNTYDDQAFGLLFPGLTGVGGPQALEGRGLGVRARNIVQRNGCADWPSFAAQTPGGLRNLPNLGRISFLEIIDVVLSAWAEHLLETGAAEAVGGRSRDTSTVEPAPIPGSNDAHDVERAPAAAAPVVVSLAVEAAREALHEILAAAWTAGATTVAEAADLLRSGRLAAPGTDSAVALLGRTPLQEIVQLSEFGADDWEWLLAFDERARTLLELRTYALSPAPTLEVLGGRFGVSRERIRQLESEARKTLSARLEHRRARGLHRLAARLRDASVLFEPGELERIAEALLSAGCPSRSNLHREILIALSGPYHDWSGYRAHGDVVRALTLAAVGFKQRGPGAHPETAELADLLGLMGQTEWTPRTLEGLGLRDINGSIVVNGRTQAERAIAVLAAHGHPMAFADLHTAVGMDVPPRSLQNALPADHRMMRRGKDSYGLREWGGEEYSGILEELEQAIARAGGRIDLADVAERFATDFGVSAGSVRIYANDPRFIRHPDGALSMRGPEDPDVQVVHRPIEKTAGAFRLDGVWHLRQEVDEEALRGSGRPVRIGIAQAVGLEPGLIIGVGFDGGQITFSWRAPQPAVGSLRAVLSRHGCGHGDVLLIPLSGSEPRAVRVLRRPDRVHRRGVQRLAAEIGLDPDDIDEDEQPLEIADALGLPAGADWYEIADRLGDRGDRGLLEHLPEHLR